MRQSVLHENHGPRGFAATRSVLPGRFGPDCASLSRLGGAWIYVAHANRPQTPTPRPARADRASHTAAQSRPHRNRPSPSFDIVRVSPEGSAVIAGRAQPGAQVVVRDGDQVLGAGAGGLAAARSSSCPRRAAAGRPDADAGVPRRLPARRSGGQSSVVVVVPRRRRRRKRPATPAGGRAAGAAIRCAAAAASGASGQGRPAARPRYGRLRRTWRDPLHRHGPAVRAGADLCRQQAGRRGPGRRARPVDADAAGAGAAGRAPVPGGSARRARAR